MEEREEQEEIIKNLIPVVRYGAIFFNIDTNLFYAYDKNQKWVTADETNDLVLKALLVSNFQQEKDNLNNDSGSRCVCSEDEWDPVPEHNICIACGKPRIEFSKGEQ